MLRSFFRWLVILFLKLLYGFKAYDTHKIPKEGSALLIANHTSWTDILAIWVLMKRKCYFMAKAELFKNPIFGFIIGKLGAYPVKRGTVDRGAYENTIKLLNEGNIVVIFPEGKRHKGRTIEAFRNGTARFALTTGAPVVPVLLTKGTKRHRSKMIEAFVGDPISVVAISPSTDLNTLSEETQKLTDELSNTMKKLLLKTEENAFSNRSDIK